MGKINFMSKTDFEHHQKIILKYVENGSLPRNVRLE